ncbi:MAG: TauD/TfdA family dioxygenase [Paracoccaceae bacterium]|nr:TauD/TfdA family dioxygenase [Paracoccaceae bacterium]
MSYNILRPAASGGRSIDAATINAARAHLHADGWVLLRGFEADMQVFSDLTAQLCRKITFDPAREYSEKNTQMVDAGLGPIGLHIENGNTPVCPDIVAFYSARAAFEGSQTTICDGRAVFAAFDDERRARWLQKVTVKRRLPEVLWKRYLANEHPAISRPEEVTEEHILQFQAAIPDQSFALNPDGSLDYALQIAPVRASALSNGQGFANAILGPSHNYEPPVYTFADGSDVTPQEIGELRAIAETCTHEINWQDGDIAILDNTRVMHGRRAIRDADRRLFIGMGNL